MCLLLIKLTAAANLPSSIAQLGSGGVRTFDLSFSSLSFDTHVAYISANANADQQISWHGGDAALPYTDSMGASPVSTNSFASFR